MTFNPLTSPVDTITLAGQVSPGTAIVEGAGSPRQWDERRGFGSSGAISVYKGAKLAKFTVKFTLWLPEHFVEWASFSELLKKPPPRVRPRAMRISHPILEDLGIIDASVEDLLQPTPDDTGAWTYECKFIQYRRPRPALATPDGADDGPEVDDAIDRQIAANTATIQALARELAP
ncbi:hypothetical protein K0U83_21525 [bacterium]|nr:hypothetical protein [bacterium]